MMKVGMVGVGCISGIYLKNFKETFKERFNTEIHKRRAEKYGG